LNEMPIKLLLVFTLGFLLTLGIPARLTVAAGLSGETEPTPLADLEPHYRASVLNGWKTFQTSFARDGLACVDCHLQLESLRHWAGAYPKVTVFDGSPYRVKSLRQVMFEVLERHTDLTPARRAQQVEDLVAFLAWWGDGQAMTPGRSHTLPPAAADLALLRAAAVRGEKLVQNLDADGCQSCHSLNSRETDQAHRPLHLAATRFPRYFPSAGQVMSIETFLTGHLQEKGRGDLSPHSEKIIDLAAYLASLAEGSTYRPGHPSQ
jgi:cytochrome c